MCLCLLSGHLIWPLWSCAKRSSFLIHFGTLQMFNAASPLNGHCQTCGRFSSCIDFFIYSGSVTCVVCFPLFNFEFIVWQMLLPHQPLPRCLYNKHCQLAPSLLLLLTISGSQWPGDKAAMLFVIVQQQLCRLAQNAQEGLNVPRARHEDTKVLHGL